MSQTLRDRAFSAGLMAFVIAMIICFAPSETRATESPRDVISRYHESLQTVWQNADGTSVRERYDELLEPIRAAFDLETMMRVATGSSWKTASESERAALVSAFTSYTTASWASRFKTYKGQRFETIGERPGPGARTIVETRIVRASGDPVLIDYVVDPASTPPRIVDVIAKGVSELARLRSDYRSTLRSEGPSGLAARIDQLAEQRLSD